MLKKIPLPISYGLRIMKAVSRSKLVFKSKISKNEKLTCPFRSSTSKISYDSSATQSINHTSRGKYYDPKPKGILNVHCHN